MASLHLSLDAASAAEHAQLAEMVHLRGGRVRTIVRWLEHALSRELDISLEPFPLSRAQDEFDQAVDTAMPIADELPAFAEQLVVIQKQAEAANSAEVLAALAKQVQASARQAVDWMLVERQLAGRRKAER